MNKKVVWGFLLLALFIGGGWYLHQRNGIPAGELVSSGTVEGREVDITAKISGRVARLGLNEGDAVRRGEEVFALEDTDLAAQVRSGAAGLDRAREAVRVAEAACADQTAGLAAAAAQIKAATAELDQAQVAAGEAARHLGQMRSLYDRNAVARESLDAGLAAKETAAAATAAARAGVAAARARERSAAAQLRVAKGQVVLARAAVRQAEADLALWRAKLAETVVTSPIAGTVVYKGVEQGETITPGMTVLTVVDLKHLSVRLDIDETRLGGVRLGAQAVLEPLAGGGKRFAGHIAAVNRYADFATQKDVAGGREDIRTFRVTVAVDEGGTGLAPGMTVRVTIPAPEGG